MTPFQTGTFAALGLAAITVAYLILSAPEGEEDWQEFVQKHHCTSVGADGGNNRGGWKCDDGQIHYRWRQQK